MNHTAIRFLCLLISSLASLPVWAQQPKTYPAGELQLALKKMTVVGTALYMAAHPDDENTAMLAYLAKERLVRAAYLSVTRGDGGQNLIGSEQAELMGLIRTQELLQARRVDGAEQFFTRANDFGFSKTTEEALEIWGKEQILGDAVWIIRNLKPDVIITRFPPDSRAGHGQHSASAVLAHEAFKVAADPKRYPEQLKFVQPWQAKRIVWNSYNPNFSNTAPKDTGSYTKVNLGAYNALLGKSYTEIAAESRSMHKSQGFGSARSRGERIDYLRHTAGEKAKDDLFENVDLTWKRVPGSETLAKTLQQAYETFRPENPAASLPLLLQAYKQIEQLPKDNYWVQVKKQELEEVIAACAGVWYEANATTFASTPGDSIKVTASVVKRSDFPVTLTKVQFTQVKKDTTVNSTLKNNNLLTLSFKAIIPANTPYTQPYWLQETPAKGIYSVNDLQLIGKPEAPAPLSVTFTFSIEGTSFTYTKPVNYKWTDPVEGELYRPFEVRPEVMVNLAEKVYMFPDTKPKEVHVVVKAGKAKVSGELSLDLPKSWTVNPQRIPFTLTKNNEEQRITFQVTPPATAANDLLKVVVKTASGVTSSKGLLTINYAHIPVQTIFPEALAKVVRLDIVASGKNIGYLMGAGDDIPASLRQVGYQVTPLTESDFATGTLDAYDAIVLGVRAFNTVDRMPFYQPKLMQYVENGGTMLVQYNVSNGLKTDELGPYPIRLSRNRVTVEDSPITFLNPKHTLLNTPNKITQKDFEGWVQERGLYFPDSLDTHYETILSTLDPNEKPQDKSVFVTQYGKGKFVYTGLSFFRQLPAGVPGAYRFFANLISPGIVPEKKENGKAFSGNGKSE
ncbi:PIG-L family deacetylase [Rhodocytophaga aerolata]|uniref:PIG-L family deacetylase n=1 Tax=Rhodocytophaga aerolata TaxID=455078 RepID=A0ABT8RBI2_9BACT|nr:PIG-L family deacetylase [Rhodocytophaga aerolata]MDO1448568.1 PIG-L family deacetylase [Rhodocytophaga aerolata]